MPDGLVEQDSAVPGSEHDVHLPGRRLAGIEHGHRLARCLLGVPFGRLEVEIPEGRAPPAAARSLLPLPVTFRHDPNAESEEGLEVVTIGRGS